jgi:hypothetical protein
MHILVHIYVSCIYVLYDMLNNIFAHLSRISGSIGLPNSILYKNAISVWLGSWRVFMYRTNLWLVSLI